MRERDDDGGHEVCEILEIQPARIYVFQRLDERVACPHDDSIVSAKAPPQIVDRGKLGDTLIVEAVADKYIEHQPTERQSRRFHRSGVDVPPQTLGRSMAVCIDLLSPLACQIKGQTLASALLGTDATGLRCSTRTIRRASATARCGAGSATRSG